VTDTARDGSLPAPRPWVPAVAGSVAFLCMAAVAGAVGVLEWLAAGEPFGARLIWKLAGLYLATFHGAGVDIRAGLQVSGGTGAPPALSGVSTLHVTFLLGTILAGAALWRAGRTVGRRVGGYGWRRMAWGASIAPTYALLVLVVSLVVRLAFPTVGITDVRAVAWEAGLGALLLAIGAGAAGAAATGLTAERPGRAAASLRGGWRMTVALVVLAFAGFLVVAGVRSDISAAYVRGVSGSEAGAVAALHHVLLLPDQSFLIAAPAMGSCLRLAGSGSQPTTLCLRTLTIRPGFGQLVLPPATPSSPVSLPIVWLLFLAVPLAATVWGGFAAGDGAGSALEAAIRGVGGGLVFAAAVVVGEGLSTIWITRDGGTILRLGADLARTGILACVWGIGGGVLGALLASRRQEPAGPAAEDPPPETPPSPTSV
jgi:hypothetical protein